MSVKKFIYEVFLFTISISFIYFSLSKMVSPNKKKTNDYMAAIIDKHNLSNSIKVKKIIFAGGSNLAFGVDSYKIQEEFNLPVVNLGLHAGLGLNFIIHEVKSIAKSGDVVFFSVEYFLSKDGDYKLKKFTSNLFPKAEKYYESSIVDDINIHIEKTRNNLKSFSFNKKKTDKIQREDLISKIYNRNSFNKNGDVIAHLNFESPENLNNRGLLVYKYWEGIEKFNEFYIYAKKNDIKVFFLYPNYPKNEYFKNQKTIRMLDRDLKNDLKMQIVNKPFDFIYDDSLFFDTVYHLNNDGRIKRTDDLIELLKNANNNFFIFN